MAEITSNQLQDAASDQKYIGAYRLTQQLGEGAFGLVYQAYQPFLDRQVAIKTLHADLTAEARIERQFMDEARTIARLRHPNIVMVYEFGTVPGQNRPLTYMVMEFLAGETLQTRMKSGPLPALDVISILEQLAQGLDYAHAQNVIHRDLKPANIMFTDRGQPVIVDFGLAKLMELSRAGQGQPNQGGILESTLSGTPAYMSPEQAAGEPVGTAADQYALATIMYEMLAGKLPYDAKDPSALMSKRMLEAPLPIRTFVPHLSPDIDAVFSRALARDPSDRYPNVTEFANALADALIPDRQRARVVTVSDPVQAAQLRIARQTVLGFLWGLVLVVLLLTLFCSSVFFRGYIVADSLFVSDGILASSPLPDGNRAVIGLWPGSVAAAAGVRFGDEIKYDLTVDRQDKAGDYSVNGQPRSALPIDWQPQLGDVIKRTVLRNGQPVEVSYAMDRSTFQIISLVAQVPTAVLGFIAAIWLLRRWGAEPGVQLFAVILLGGSFSLIASGVSGLIPNIETLALCLLMAAVIHFMLVFPEPMRYVEQHPRRVWWIYAPCLVPLVEFIIGSDLWASFNINLLIYCVYGLAIFLIIVVKWGRRDLKHYPGLWWLVGMFVLMVITVVISAFFFGITDFDNVKTLFGNAVNEYNWIFIVIIGGSAVAVIMGVIGYHKVQLQLGPSLIMQDTRSGKLASAIQ